MNFATDMSSKLFAAAAALVISTAAMATAILPATPAASILVGGAA